jgi:hypothetical protein
MFIFSYAQNGTSSRAIGSDFGCFSLASDISTEGKGINSGVSGGKLGKLGTGGGKGTQSGGKLGCIGKTG